MSDAAGSRPMRAPAAKDERRVARPRGDVVALSARRLPVALAVAAALLVVLYAASKLAVGCPACPAIETFVHLDREANLPTWFSTLLWLLAGALAGVVALTARRLVWHWRGLAALCVFLSLDEASMVHETFGSMVGSAVSASDYIFYDWLLYGFAATLAAALVFLPFLRSLPRGTALRILLAGAVFLSGAIGVEMLGGASRAGATDLIQGRALWGLQLMVEEFLEMAGVILLIHALLHHLSTHRGLLSFSVR